jgi:hypothetical protein
MEQISISTINSLKHHPDIIEAQYMSDCDRKIKIKRLEKQLEKLVAKKAPEMQIAAVKGKIDLLTRWLGYEVTKPKAGVRKD